MNNVNKNNTYKKENFFSKLRKKLTNTRNIIKNNIDSLLTKKKYNNKVLLEQLEDNLIRSNIGIHSVQEIMQYIEKKVNKKNINKEELNIIIKKKLTNILKPHEKKFVIDEKHKPYFILVIGVNGSGKTTTIGKLSKKIKSKGYSIVIAAGDTFRAAATEQLKSWGEYNNISIISNQKSNDSASVIFDAFLSAKSKNIDVIIADSAGRLHNNNNLMNELKKIIKVIKKIDKTAPHEIILTIDACTGHNAINQVQSFNEIAPISNIILTKMDGTTKGGILITIANKFKIPISFIGIGENTNDLNLFKSQEFIEAIIEDNKN